MAGVLEGARDRLGFGDDMRDTPRVAVNGDLVRLSRDVDPVSAGSRGCTVGRAPAIASKTTPTANERTGFMGCAPREVFPLPAESADGRPS